MGKLYKRMLRQVRAAKGQFFSVVIIIAIGAAIFAGMFASVGGMTSRLDEYYSDQNLADSWLYFRGISQDDMESVFAEEPGIAFEGRYTYDAQLTVNNAESELRIRSLTDINSTYVSEGRLPQAMGEILVDAKYFSENKLAIGDTLYLHTEDGDFPVTITGIGHNPEAILIQKDAFSASVSHRAFGLGYATPETLIALNKTTVLYHELAQDIEDALAEARQALKDGESEISEGETEYNRAVLAAEQAAAEGKRELESARQAIDNGYAELEAKRAEGEALLAEKQAQIDAGALQLAAAKQELDNAYAEYLARREGLPQAEREQIEAYFAQGYAELDAQQQSLDDNKAILAQEMADATAIFDARQTEIDGKRAALDNDRTALDAAHADYLANERPGLPEEEQIARDADFDEQFTALQFRADEITAVQSQLESERASAQAGFVARQLQLDLLQAQLDSARLELDNALAQYLSVRDGVPPEMQARIEAHFADLYAQYDKKAAELAAAQAMLDAARADGEAQLAAGQQALAEAEAQYQTGLRTYNNMVSEGNAQLAEARQALDDARQELADGWAEYESQREEAADSLAAAAKLYPEVLIRTSNTALAEALAAEHDNFIVGMTRDTHFGYQTVEASLEPYITMSLVFPVIFFLVAATIAFISISKMVEHQRSQIAVMRAMGVAKGKIRASFLSYSLTASAVGAISFALLGNLIVPHYITGIFRMEFDLPGITTNVQPRYIVLPFLLAALFTGLAALIAVQRVLRETPSQAMRPRSPKSSRGILLERWAALWKRLRYGTRLALRNIFLGKKRIIISSVGVIGSAMLLIAGFSLRNSANAIIDSTVDLMAYDLAVALEEPIDDIADAPGAAYASHMEFTDTTNATLTLEEDIGLKVQFVEPGSTLVRLYDHGGNLIEFTENTVVLPQTLAAEYSLNPGASITVEIRGEKVSFIATDISEQYLAKTLYVSTGTARYAGADIKNNMVLMQIQDGTDVAAVQAELYADPEVLGVTSSEEFIGKASDAVAMMNAVTVVVIIAAAILAVAVLYNISTVNIMERTREYATLLVLGYSRKEVNKMVSSENTALTVLGCLLGIPFGLALYTYIAAAISRDDLTMPGGFNLFAILASVIFTMLFSLLTNKLLQGKIKQIHLAEEIKSME